LSGPCRARLLPVGESRRGAALAPVRGERGLRNRLADAQPRPGAAPRRSGVHEADRGRGKKERAFSLIRRRPRMERTVRLASAIWLAITLLIVGCMHKPPQPNTISPSPSTSCELGVTVKMVSYLTTPPGGCKPEESKMSYSAGSDHIRWINTSPKDET